MANGIVRSIISLLLINFIFVNLTFVENRFIKSPNSKEHSYLSLYVNELTKDLKISLLAIPIQIVTLVLTNNFAIALLSGIAVSLILNRARG